MLCTSNASSDLQKLNSQVSCSAGASEAQATWTSSLGSSTTLGSSRVVGILDNDKASDRDSLAATFPDYHFAVIPAKDIRTKPARPATDAVEGLLDDKNREVRPELANATRDLLVAVNAYLQS